MNLIKIKICKNCSNRGQELKDGFFCKFYNQITYFKYEDMIVECEGCE